MNTSTIDLLAGLLIAVGAAAGGLSALLLALVLGGVGFIAGRYLSDAAKVWTT